MRFFTFFKATELVTPPLDGMILPGVTRDSVLSLARDHASGKSPLAGMPEGEFVVNERPVTMKEVKAAAESGNLVEFFGTGAYLHLFSLSPTFPHTPLLFYSLK